jgi:formate dehydrogenase beta subunit
MDAARSALRLGAKEVHIVYRRDREQVPAQDAEFRATEEEGAIMHLLANPVLIHGDRAVTGVRLQRQMLGDLIPPPPPVPIKGSEFDMSCDLLVPAIARSPGWMMRVGCIEGFLFSGQSIKSICPGFCGRRRGLGGPATVVQGLPGNHVAVAVDAWLTSGKLDGVYCRPVGHDIPQLFNIDDYANAHRPHEEELSPEERIGRQDFCEVEMGMDERVIREECKRCLRCDLEWLERIGEPLP